MALNHDWVILLSNAGPPGWLECFHVDCDWDHAGWPMESLKQWGKRISKPFLKATTVIIRKGRAERKPTFSKLPGFTAKCLCSCGYSGLGYDLIMSYEWCMSHNNSSINRRGTTEISCGAVLRQSFFSSGVKSITQHAHFIGMSD